MGLGAKRQANDAPGAALRVFTVEDAVGLAKKNSAQLSALEAGTEAAQARIEAADRRTNPELRITQLRLDRFVEREPQLRTAIRFKPDRPGEVDAEIAEARAAGAEARAEAQAEAIALEADVRWLFDDVVLLDAEIAAAETVAEKRRDLAAQMKRRLEAAAATAIDDAAAEIAAVEAESSVAELRARRSEALGDLLDRIGVDRRASVEIVGEPPLAWPPADLPAEQALVEEALRRRPEISIAAARIDAADARTYAERSRRWPWLSYVELGYQFTPETVQTGLGWTMAAGLELPIFDTNHAGVAAATREKSASQRALASEVDRVVREVRLYLGAAEAARALVTDLRARTLPAAARAASATSRALDDRSVDVVDALSVDAKRVQMELRLLGHIRRYREAVSELRRAVGGRLPARPSK